MQRTCSSLSTIAGGNIPLVVPGTASSANSERVVSKRSSATAKWVDHEGYECRRRCRAVHAPREHALVPCRDDKSQVQALDRTRLGLPQKKGRAQTITHDYKRHDTTTLFATVGLAQHCTMYRSNKRSRRGRICKVDDNVSISRQDC